MVFEYGFGATFATVSPWIASGGLIGRTSTRNTATAAALDGNAAANRITNRGGAINALWNANDTPWPRWIERNDTAHDHGHAIDNFSSTAGKPKDVLLPAAAWLLLFGLGGLGLITRCGR